MNGYKYITMMIWVPIILITSIFLFIFSVVVFVFYCVGVTSEERFAIRLFKIYNYDTDERGNPYEKENNK